MTKVFWGCSEDWVPKSIFLYSDVTKIVDINSEQFDTFYGLEVISPESIKQEAVLNNVTIIITTGSYESVKEQLGSWGLKDGYNFFVSDVMKDFACVDRLSKQIINLKFSSSDYDSVNSQRGSRLGGGIYNARIGPYGGFTFKKEISGSFRQMASFQNGNVAAVEYVKRDIIIFDKKFNIVKSKHVNIPHMTGIAVDGDQNVFVISSGLDKIFLLDHDLEFVEEHSIPWVGEDREYGSHHINDCHYHNNQLFFTFFSKTGAWRQGLYDGGIGVFDTQTKAIRELCCNLTQPHSPKIYENELYFCESPKGILWHGTENKICEIPGFIRGFHKSHDYTVLGQSDTLYISKFLRDKIIWLGAGFHVVDEANKIAEFHKVPGLKNIHDFIVEVAND